MISKSTMASQSEDSFKILFEEIPGLYLVLLPNLLIYAVSDDYASATLTKREDIVGKHLFEVFPDNPDDIGADGLSNLKASLEFVIKNKIGHTMAVQKYDIRRPDGTFEERYWSPHNKPILNRDGGIIFIVHRVEDVTQFVLLQKQHAASESSNDALNQGLISMEMEIVKRSHEIQKLNESLEQRVAAKMAELETVNKVIFDYKFALDTSCIVAVTDQKGTIIHVNDNFCTISKYSREELLGQDHRIINSGHHAKDFIRNLWVTIANGKIWRGELMNRAKDGSNYWVDTTIVPFLNDHGKPYQYIAIRADITARKIAEEENQKLHADLELRVQQRTEELEAFSYSVSHDLRAPLRAVNGYAKILEEDYSKILDGEGNRLLGIVQEGAKKMGVLIDDLLAFSKLGKKEVSKSKVNMQSLVESVCDDLRKLPGYKAKMEIGEIHPLMADFTLMSHVWVNLLSNAVKYSSNKENPVIKIRSEKDKDRITYSVADNGAGFDMKYAHKLFGVFQRLHSTEDFEGTGVGLAIVHRVITKHKGKIWAEGVPGEGATFYFSLPVE